MRAPRCRLSLRAELEGAGIRTRQAYLTAELGAVAWETDDDGGHVMPGMLVNDDLIVEIVTPGTNDPAPEGDVGEVVVTRLSGDYPLLRFATGDLSRWAAPGRLVVPALDGQRSNDLVRQSPRALSAPDDFASRRRPSSGRLRGHLPVEGEGSPLPSPHRVSDRTPSEIFGEREAIEAAGERFAAQFDQNSSRSGLAAKASGGGAS